MSLPSPEHALRQGYTRWTEARIETDERGLEHHQERTWRVHQTHYGSSTEPFLEWKIEHDWRDVEIWSIA